jgi:calcium-dependent protein kinase
MGQCSFSNPLAVDMHDNRSLTATNDLMTLSSFRDSGESKGKTERTTIGNPLDQFFAQYVFSNVVLGKGRTGTVRQAVYRPIKQLRAIKVVSKRHADSKFNKSSKQEAELLASVDHPNIVRMFESIEDNQDFYMVTELAHGKNLFNLIEESGPVSEKTAMLIMRQILFAINYLHSHDIMHRNIQPEKIVFDGRTVKFVNLNSAMRINPAQKMSAYCDPSHFTAPEVVLRFYSMECDVWSAGALMFYLITGRFLFKASTKAEIMSSILSLKFEFDSDELKNASKNSISLLVAMLNSNPSKRITIAKALSHQWFSEAGLCNSDDPWSCLLRPIKFTDPLQKIAYRMIVILSEHVPSKLNMIELFHHLDKNHQGKLIHRQLERSLISSLNSTDSFDCDQQSNQPKENPTNSITFTDFLSHYSNPKCFVDQHTIDLMFNYFDPDKEGKLKSHQVVHFAAPFFRNSPEWDELAHDLSVRWFATIDHDEFTSILNSLKK